MCWLWYSKFYIYSILFWIIDADHSYMYDLLHLYCSIDNFFIFLYPVPTERSTILKENFNRWYSVKSYYLSICLIDLPISTLSCLLFSVIIYVMTGWPLEWLRFSVFFVVSLLIVLVAQTVGLIIGSCFNVIVSTCPRAKGLFVLIQQLWSLFNIIY